MLEGVADHGLDAARQTFFGAGPDQAGDEMAALKEFRNEKASRGIPCRP